VARDETPFMYIYYPTGKESVSQTAGRYLRNACYIRERTETPHDENPIVGPATRTIVA
jgi:hypothetical protein